MPVPIKVRFTGYFLPILYISMWLGSVICSIYVQSVLSGRTQELSPHFAGFTPWQATCQLSRLLQYALSTSNKIQTG